MRTRGLRDFSSAAVGKVVLGLAVAAIVFAAGRPARALTIEVYDIGATPMTAEQLSAFMEAAALWEDILKDPITVKIDAEFVNLGGSGILGATYAMRTTHFFTAVRSALLSASDSSTETNALNLLPASTVPIFDTNGVRNDSKVTLTTANAKALGIGTGLDPVYGCPPGKTCPLPNSADALMQFNTNYSFDFNRADGVSLSKHDFVTVAAHEIGHVLGFGSTTDVQDHNPGFTLHLTTLDLWRFCDCGLTTHAIGSEVRQMTAGPAEYYDSVLNHRELSWGDTMVDGVCGTANDKCQASHWRDTLGNLMDPTLAKGIMVNPAGNDKWALDYIGYDADVFLIKFNPKFFAIAWFLPPGPWPCLSCPIPEIGGFKDYPPPPSFRELPRLGFAPNLAMRLGLDLGVQRLGKHSGLGWAQFQDESENSDPKTIRPSSFLPETENINPPVEPMRRLPASLLHFVFQANDSAGKSFTFTDTLADTGAQFDPSLGRYGGYRLTGFVDGVGDDIPGDVDGTLTILLLADRSGKPDGREQNVFGIAPEDGESALVVYDPRALGVKTAGGFQRPGDCNQDGTLDLSDGVCLLGHLFQGKPETLPCAGGTKDDPDNLALLSSNGDSDVDLSDAVYVLQFLFAGGPPPALGAACVEIEGCPDRCE